MTNHDIPSPIDFSNLEEARKWIEDTVLTRPWRPDFFRAFASQIAQHLTALAKIVELGAGPGLLAEEILKCCIIERYILVDFSAPMLDFARHRLKPFDGITRYLREDFRSDGWTDGLSGFDAVVTLQAVHEVRHKRHVAHLYDRIFSVIRPGGYFLVADHYVTETNERNSDLYFNSEDQRNVLIAAGFDRVTLILDKGDMALYRACRP